MEDFEKRVIKERAELDVKITALAAFRETNIFDGLPADEKDRLGAQLRVMLEYSSVLTRRIDNF